MIRNSRNRFITYSFSHRLYLVFYLLIATLLFAGCGGHKKDPGNGNSQPTNIGGGYTLMASGGTLNDGSGVNGLVILATLRDSQGWGPVLPWTITISGPGSLADYPLTVEYSDPRIGSYMSWEWATFDPSAGSYRVTATNGTTTIYYDFNLTVTTLSRPAPNASYTGNDMTVTWPAVSGAGSYAYDVCSPDAVCISGITTTLSTIASFATLSAGDYLVRVTAYATDRKALNADHTASPGLASQEKVSEYSFTVLATSL